MEELGQGEDSEITHQLLSQAKKDLTWERLIYCQLITEQSSEK